MKQKRPQIGDLVKLSADVSHGFRDHLDSIGVVAEWSGTSGWVQWAGNPDWDIEYQEDLEIINEAR